MQWKPGSKGKIRSAAFTAVWATLPFGGFRFMAKRRQSLVLRGLTVVRVGLLGVYVCYGHDELYC